MSTFAPTLYKPTDVGKLFAARTSEFFAEGRKAGLAPAHTDRRRVIALFIDFQVDFVHAEGTLVVPGAIEDGRRTVEWMYRNAAEVTAFAASLDSHLPVQIFYPSWWKNLDTGEHPNPFTPITLDEVKRGVWQPLVDPTWSLNYLEQLERDAKQLLMIWPYHTMIGTAGHNLLPPISEALAFHSGARLAQPIFLNKGMIPRVEHYGIVEPEVKDPKHPLGGTNTAFLDMLSRYDLIYVFGEAKSHCVLATMKQIVRYFATQPEVLRKIRFVTDCTSSVQHPSIDFEAIAQGELDLMAKQGVEMVTSSDPIG